MKKVLPNSTINQPAPLSVCVTACVKRSLSTACAAAFESSLLLKVFPCVTLVGFISAICSLRSEHKEISCHVTLIISILVQCKGSGLLLGL